MVAQHFNPTHVPFSSFEIAMVCVWGVGGKVGLVVWGGVKEVGSGGKKAGALQAYFLASTLCGAGSWRSTPNRRLTFKSIFLPLPRSLLCNFGYDLQSRDTLNEVQPFTPTTYLSLLSQLCRVPAVLVVGRVVIVQYVAHFPKPSLSY